MRTKRGRTDRRVLIGVAAALLITAACDGGAADEVRYRERSNLEGVDDEPDEMAATPRG